MAKFQRLMGFSRYNENSDVPLTTAVHGNAHGCIAENSAHYLETTVRYSFPKLFLSEFLQTTETLSNNRRTQLDFDRFTCRKAPQIPYCGLRFKETTMVFDLISFEHENKCGNNDISTEFDRGLFVAAIKLMAVQQKS